MKKWYYAMLALVLPMLAILVAACSDDDKDLPNVDISLEVSKGTVVDGTMYVVAGDTLQISSIEVKNNEAGKAATVANVNYYWDGYFYAPAVFAPFGMTFPTDSEDLGNHTIGVTCNVLAVDKSIAIGALSYPVKVVASADELPSATGNTIVGTTKLQEK